MDCPNCRLINPPSALRCDCGFDFRSKSVEASYIRGGVGGAVPAQHTLGAGLLLVGIAVAITVLTYATAAPGGVYFIAWGPALWGVRLIARDTRFN